MSEIIVRAVIRIKTEHVIGKNHAECFKKLKSAVEQGFLAVAGTNVRFVDRKEALEIAINAGQSIDKHPPMDKLLSEDLARDKYYNGGQQ